MDSLNLDGSPTPRKHGTAEFAVHEDAKISEPSQGSSSLGLKRENSANQPDLHLPLPLTTSKLANQLPQHITRRDSFKKQKIDLPTSSVNIDPTDHFGKTHSPMDELLAKLSEQQVLLTRQKNAQHALNARQVSVESVPSSKPSSGSQSDPYAYSGDDSADVTNSPLDPAEVLRLKKELEMAQSKIARMDQELSQSRITKHTFEQAVGPHFGADFDEGHGLGIRGGNMTASWVHSAESGPAGLPANLACPPPSGIWAPGPNMMNASAGPMNSSMTASINGGVTIPGLSNTGTREPSPSMMSGISGQFPRQQHPALRINTGRMGPFGLEPSPIEPPRRDGSLSSRPGSAFGNHPASWGGFGTSTYGSDHLGYTPPMTPLPFSQMHNPMHGPNMHHMGGMPANGPYMPRPIGSRLSPTAVEFNASHAGQYSGPSPWNMQGSTEPPSSYLSTAEPMNYRRLLDRNMSCNWKYIVDKIVCSNDQQASIFLQQKLKVGTSDQKFEIVQAIIDQAYPLMINRFGNFLVQRCFEHGTPEQIISIARAIRGHTLNLSMDAFGCHVVQKAFDCVPEEYKAIMVHELLRRIPETVIHRYACHVWQKLFELRWSDSPPQIMKYVNEALRGMWHEVALGETGSLVVQNIFENCLEEDKRPCINEVLASIDVVAHGQFGNWCIQHICEHGSIPDRTRAIDHVLRFATEYSMDQFASKVVEKCLKIGGPDFLDRYLDRVCEARSDRPRMPLIDIAGDQFGNYLVQYILTHADPQRREIVAAHIRKHMVSLRGSKYGSRVAMLCCNPAFTTRPGPPTGGPMSRGGNSSYGDRPSYPDRPYGGGGSRNGPYGGGYC